MHVNQVAREIVGVRGVRQHGAPGPGPNRQHSSLGIIRAKVFHDAEQDTVAVRQHLGPTVPLLLTGRIWKRYDLDFPAILRDP